MICERCTNKEKQERNKSDLDRFGRASFDLCRHVVGYFLELLRIPAKLGTSHYAISMLRHLLAAPRQRSSYSSEEWIETLGPPARISGIHQEHTLASPAASTKQVSESQIPAITALFPCFSDLFQQHPKGAEASFCRKSSSNSGC